MTPRSNDTQTIEVSQEEFCSMLYERMRLAIQVTLTTILDEEIEAFVNAERYQSLAAGLAKTFIQRWDIYPRQRAVTKAIRPLSEDEVQRLIKACGYSSSPATDNRKTFLK
jgi:integrase